MLGREPVEVDLDGDRRLPHRTRSCSSPAPAARSAPSSAARSPALGPTRLVLVDNAEPALFEIERELVARARLPRRRPRSSPTSRTAPSCARSSSKYRPAVVFHAAAYKHVPLMEANPLEAVRNNALGTRTLADVAVEFGAKRFVLVSTDKAVNPKTVMGQSKALCEWIVETWGHRDDVADAVRGVRFGNVLGSSGSVIPIFRRADRARRPGHGHAPGDDALLHDDPRGRAARHPGRRDRRARPGLRARHGRAGEDHRPRGEDDPPLGQGARARHRDRVRSGPRPARSCTRSSSATARSSPPTSHPKIVRITRPPIDAAWLEDELAELERLVEEGETLELVGELSRIVGDPRRSAPAVGVSSGRR